MTDVNAKDMVGKTVVTPDGTEVGALEEVRFDPARWAITGFVVSLRDTVAEDMRLHKPMLGKAQLSISPERVRGVGDYVTLNVTLPQLVDLVKTQSPTEPEPRR